MSRLNLVLVVALMLSCMYLVRVSYETRRLFAELDKAQGDERALEHEHERLNTELRTQATPLRVERTARERLAMRTATPAVTYYLAAAPASSIAGGRAVASSNPTRTP